MVSLKKNLNKLLKIISFTILIIIFNFFYSCQKKSINGDLDGMWQVMEVNPKPSENIIENRLYYGFYMHVCNLSFYGGVYTEGKMIYNNSHLGIFFPYDNNPNFNKVLKQYGINSNPVVFEVKFLDKNKLILHNDETSILLRKF